MSVSDRVTDGNVHAVYDPGELVYNDGYLDEVLELTENNNDYAAAANNNGTKVSNLPRSGLQTREMKPLSRT
jgi:hypothetical protein